jgi:hypothetical protein
MNTVPLIAKNSVVGMQYIGGNNGYRPVFRLTLSNGGAVVVKAEKTAHATAASSIHWGSKIMKNTAGNDVNVKVLTQDEIREVARARQRLLPADNDFNTYIEFGTQVVWVKMPMITGLSDSDIYRQGADAANALYEKMNVPQFWTELGHVLAVDLFIGNFDRFNGEGELINEGNVFFKDLGAGQFRVVGLDFFAAQFGATEANLSAFENSLGQTFEYLNVLRDPARRTAYSRTVIESLRHALLKENKSGIYDLYGHRQTLANAIDSGANDIRTYLVGKVAQYQAARPRIVMGGNRMPALPALPAQPQPAANAGWHRAGPRIPENNTKAVQKDVIPAGIKARMRYLGWIQ